MTANNCKPLRMAIIGLGKMGRLHLKTWQRIPEVQVAAIVDHDTRLTEWVEKQGAAFLDDVRALPGLIDFAVVATPSAAHLDSALPLLEAGIHCLIEKPLALDFSASRTLVSAARSHQTLLAVGHSERFNPSIHLAHSAVAAKECTVEVIRAAPYASTQSDSDVVQDLMVHDIDWILQALGPPLGEVNVLEKRSRKGQLSHVSCRLSFADGKRVTLTACREADVKRRHVVLLEGNQVSQLIDLDSPVSADEPDALTRQAMAFLHALQGRPSPIALGSQALAVMHLSDRVRLRCMSSTEGVTA